MMKTDGYYILGVYLAMAANRISYAFDFKGPSYVCDAACASSFHALAGAISDLKTGTVENAIVGCTQLNFSPHKAIEFGKLNTLSPEGMSRAFCVGRNGYARSEAIVTFFLQKQRNSKRVYSTIVGVGRNVDGYKKEGITFPSAEDHINLMKQMYDDLQINPDDISYFEAHGTGKNNVNNFIILNINFIWKIFCSLMQITAWKTINIKIMEIIKYKDNIIKLERQKDWSGFFILFYHKKSILSLPFNINCKNLFWNYSESWTTGYYRI